jgi:hypothetical protein
LRELAALGYDDWASLLFMIDFQIRPASDASQAIKFRLPQGQTFSKLNGPSRGKLGPSVLRTPTAKTRPAWRHTITRIE